MPESFSIDECDVFTAVHDVYPLIDPEPYFTSKAYKGKVIIITGGSTGIGATSALFYAKAGAKVVIVARRVEKLYQCKEAIESSVPGAEILSIPGDISDPEVGERAVRTAVDTYGRLDIVLANHYAGTFNNTGRFADKDPAVWWNTQIVSVRGTLNIVHASIPELLKVNGQILVTTSTAAHVRVPAFFDYSISKHTLNRFIEILALDYPSIAMYSVHPGNIITPGSLGAMQDLGFDPETTVMPDSLELPAATFLWLTARNAEFLSGRYVQATWDLNEVVAKKKEIVRDDLLVTKLAGPAKSV